jgi:hypothetical protein
MGLDQYLNAKRFVSPAEWRGKESQEKYEKVSELFGMNEIKTASVPHAIVEFGVGYWRKANAVHQWFVDNVQGGQDDCKSYYVDREQLQQLKDICLKIAADRSLASELLPTQGGFFFGSTEYDEWYFEDLENTIAIIDNAFSLGSDWDFEYSSSW